MRKKKEPVSSFAIDEATGRKAVEQFRTGKPLFGKDGAFGPMQPASKSNEFLLYPNPSHGTIEVKYEVPGELRLYDVTGREVNNSPLPMPGNRIISIDIRQLPAGAYMYQYWSSDLVVKSEKLAITY